MGFLWGSWGEDAIELAILFGFHNVVLLFLKMAAELWVVTFIHVVVEVTDEFHVHRLELVVLVDEVDRLSVAKDHVGLEVRGRLSTDE